MDTRKMTAAEKKASGKYNCAQAVLCTYSDLTGIEEETSRNLCNGFATGMGNMEGTCGALVGAGIALGLISKDKAQTMKGMRKMMTRFQERNHATQCKMLKGVETKQILRECPMCVADACEFLEDIINKKA